LPGVETFAASLHHRGYETDQDRERTSERCFCEPVEGSPTTLLIMSPAVSDPDSSVLPRNLLLQCVLCNLSASHMGRLEVLLHRAWSWARLLNHRTVIQPVNWKAKDWLTYKSAAAEPETSGGNNNNSQ